MQSADIHNNNTRNNNNMVNDTFQTIAGTLGNVLEWYDFGIYGFFSDTISQVFFPPSNSAHHNLILSYLVFGGAFFMRPIGGLITGHVGDKHGRKHAVVLSLLFMSIPTVAMGVLPTYEQVGGWSTALLVICRLLQGFSVGGQLPSSLVYTLEMKPKEHWGYYGSMFSFANNMGGILGNLVGALIRTLVSEDQLLQWGWRVAFLSGIFITPAAFVLHLYGADHHPNEGAYDSDSNDETENEEQTIVSSITATMRKNHPVKEALRRENLAALTASFLVPLLLGAGYYITFVWMAIFMDTLLDPPVQGAFWVNLLSSVLGMMLVLLFAGWLSDRYGRNKVMIVGAVGMALVAPVMVWIISWGKTVQAFFAQWTIGCLLALFSGPAMAWQVEIFPQKIRLTAASIGYNLGLCLSAGFAPAIATTLVAKYGPVAPGFLYPFFAILALIGMAIALKIPQEEEGKERASLGGETSTRSDFIEESTEPLIAAAEIDQHTL